MASYRLLRNNKETGPYTLEALVQLGLKPYDLVWEEGRSAAWRYPSEIQALKFYAPAVEEQPYDRFYKKPSEVKKEEENKEIEKQQSNTPQVKLVNIKEVEAEKTNETKEGKTVVEITTPKKQVFVSLPANLVKKTEQQQQPAAKNIVEPVTAYKEENTNSNSYKINEPVSPSYNELVNDYNSYQPQEKKIPLKEQSTITHKEAYPLETKYTQSLDDIKDIYAQTLLDRKKKTAQKKMIGKMLKRGLPFAAVLVVGFFLGSFLMNDNDSNKNAALQQQSNATLKKDDAAIDKLVLKQDPKTESSTNQPAEDPAVTLQSQVTIPEASESKQINDGVVVSKLNSIQKYVDQQKEAKPADKQTKKQGDPVGFLNESKNAETAQAPKNIEADPQTGERNRIVRSSSETNANDNSTAATKVASTKNNPVWKQVSVKSNDYKKGTFGGIHGLQLTVNNTSNYLLDKVVVELQYLKQNEEALKTENINFNMVPPNGSLTLGIPPSMRGVKIAYRVINVESKAAGDTVGL